MELRTYQLKAIQSTFDYLAENPGKNPCLVLPTGSGKSVCIAAFIKAALEWWPGIKIMILTHQKELIEQDARALHRTAPDLSIGLYSSSIRCKDLSQPVTFASIQSIYKISVPDVRFILIDEAHLINNEDQGMYRRFLGHSRARVIGLTATPYRMGQGYLTDGDGIFDDLIQPVSILELQGLGYLAKLRSKGTFTKLDVSNVRLRGGEFIDSDLQKELDTFTTNESVAEEIIRSAAYYRREHILIFCSGVEHARHISEILSEKGMKAAYIAGNMSMEDREEILYCFTHGHTTALCNANLLTTGFDYPDIDMIAMLRPTMSPGLYLQMAGRGLRLKSNGGDCLILDFAGNVQRHGPVAFVSPPARKGEARQGVMPCKECPQCLEIVPLSLAACPSCGYVFPKNSLTWVLYDGDVNGDGYEKHSVWKWSWMITSSRKNNTPMIVCEFRTNGNDRISKYFFVWHERMRRKSIIELIKVARKAGVDLADDFCNDIQSEDDWWQLISVIEACERPQVIITKRSEQDRRYKNIAYMLWASDIEELKGEAEKEKEVIEDARRKLLG